MMDPIETPRSSDGMLSSRSSHSTPRNNDDNHLKSNRVNDVSVGRHPPMNFRGFLQRLERFDIYTKIDDDYRLQTSEGATMSILAWIIISFLVLGEFRNFMTVNTNELLKVDTTIGQKLKINLDITFHALTCAEAHLDAMDVAGDNQLNIEHQMMKQRISSTGVGIGAFAEEAVGKMVKQGNVKLPADYCGSCFGAETELTKCCNTCIALKKAYQAKGWGLSGDVKNSEQCLRDGEDPYALAVDPGEGCRIKGTMGVNKVAGNFHIAHGESIVKDGRHIHQFLPAEAHTFNISHTIHSISFGQVYPGQSPNPLEKKTFIIPTDGSTGLKQYFIKVVPAYYQDQTTFFTVHMESNQYSYTERFRPLMLPDPHTGTLTQQMAVLPGIFFVYDLQPFMIHSTKTSMPFTHLITRLLAIVGGVYSVCGMTDSLIFRIQKFFKK